MRSPAGKHPLGRALALFAVLSLGAGCSHMPWHRSAPPPPPPVHEVELSGGHEFPQYWERNTLLLDMSGVSDSGSVTIKPVAGTSWPVRIAVRVRPGSFPQLEVRGDQRLFLPVASSAEKPFDLEFDPGVYTAKTPQIVISWGTEARSAPVSAPPVNPR
ncbi:MAG: hypothetical protein JSR36_04265 [Proteobacteria bacterium]|nr:hypothetical protein [Pseudomonadota bacterium]